MKTIFNLILFVCFLTASTNALAEEKESSSWIESDKLKVLCTTGMIADIVENIAGDTVALNSLMGPGTDPHLYRATMGDLKKLKAADVVFYNGLSLEGKMEEVFQKLGEQKPVIAVSSTIHERRLLSAENYQNAYDPHIWFDIGLWTEATKVVEAELIKQLPNKSEELARKATVYRATLNKIDDWTGRELFKIPTKQRVLITAHDAFRYFGKKYNVEVRGLQGISSASDYGLKDIKVLSDLIIERKLKAIFVESSVPEKFIESLQEAVSSKGGEVKVGGTLYSDAMGPVGSGAETFQKMFRHNVKTIAGALK